MSFWGGGHQTVHSHIRTVYHCHLCLLSPCFAHKGTWQINNGYATTQSSLNLTLNALKRYRGAVFPNIWWHFSIKSPCRPLGLRENELWEAGFQPFLSGPWNRMSFYLQGSVEAPQTRQHNHLSETPIINELDRISQLERENKIL